MNVIYHLIGIAMVIVLIAKLEGEIERQEPLSAEYVETHRQAAQPTPAAWTRLGESSSPPPAGASVARATFMGKPCAQSDCAGDLAGYRWAEENGITEPARCEVLEGEFADGCRLFARMEQQYNI
jgi:hypothetical protein